MRRATALVLLLVTAGCSTIQHGPMQRIAVDSQPQGAEVTLRECGLKSTKTATTPAKVWVSRRSTKCEITLAVGDYRPYSVRLTRYAQPGASEYFWGVIDFCAEGKNCNSLTDLFAVAVVGSLLILPGLAVDASTGAFFQQDPPRVFVDFEAIAAQEQ